MDAETIKIIIAGGVTVAWTILSVLNKNKKQGENPTHHTQAHSRQSAESRPQPMPQPRQQAPQRPMQQPMHQAPQRPMQQPRQQAPQRPMQQPRQQAPQRPMPQQMPMPARQPAANAASPLPLEGERVTNTARISPPMAANADASRRNGPIFKSKDDIRRAIILGEALAPKF